MTKRKYPIQRASINQFAKSFKEQTGLDLKENGLIIHSWSLYAAPILDNYYSTAQSQDINQFIGSLELKGLTSSTGEKPYLKWEALYSEISDNAKLCNLKKWRLLGDPHQSPHNKFFSSKSVYHIQEHDHEIFIRDLIERFFPYLSECIPTYSKDCQIYKRDFLETTKERISNEDIRQFYFLIGSFIAFSLSFRMYDVHAENIMAKKNRYPFFYDLECLLLPATNGEQYNIEFTGFVKLSSPNDYSVLSGGKKKATSFFTPIYVGEMQTPRIKWDIEYDHPFMNTPEQEGKKIYSDKYHQDIEDGYAHFTELFNKQKNDIRDYTRDNVVGSRLVLRLTRFYTRLLRESNFASTMKQYGDREEYLQEMLVNPEFELKTESIDTERLVHLEREILLRNLIPVFRSVSNSKEILLNGETVGVLSETQLDTWEQYIEGDIFTEGIQYLKRLNH